MNGKLYRVVWCDPQIGMDFDRYFNTQLQAEEYANTLRFVYQTLGCDSTDIDNMEITIEEETNDKTNYKNYR
jgi:hypothetical protein